MKYRPNSKTLLFFAVVLTINGLSAQTQTPSDKAFDSVFFDTAVRLSTKDIVKSGEIADSLYQASTSDLQRIKSLMLSADLLEKQNKRVEAIAYVLRADSLVSAIENYEWEARICGFLSTQYRIIGLTDQGKRYLRKGMEAADKITPQSTSDQYKGLVHQEMAHYAMDDKDYAEAIRLLKKVELYFSDIKNEQIKNFFFGNNEEMLGRGYLGLKAYDSAKQHYFNALEFLEKVNAGESQWAGMTFHGLGKIALENKEYPQALDYLTKADTLAKIIDHTYLKGLVNRDLGGYYKAMGDMEKYSFHAAEHLKNINKNLSSTRAASNVTVNRIYNEQQANRSTFQMVIIASGILLFSSLLLYYFTRRKRRRERERYNALIAKFNATRQEGVNGKISPAPERDERFMPEETELALLRKLEEFETKNEFTNPNISLSALAVDIKTNTKYLSHVINTHKKKDFNNYVNELRVFYIIQKIQEDPKYLNYKISYLSEECGFSSHSKFTTVFKNTTGLTPSVFLNQVNNAKNG